MKLLQIAGDISKVTTMSNRSLRLVVDTQENLTDEEVTKVMAWHEKRGWFLFAAETIKEEDVLNLPDAPLSDDDTKTPAKRLRDRMYVYFRKTHGDSDRGFEEWYRIALDGIGSKYLDKVSS